MVIVLAGISGGFIGGFYSDKIGRKKLMIIADSVVGLMFVGIALVNSPWYNLPYITFGLFIITFFFSGIMGPVAQAMIIDVSSPDNRKFVFTMSYWATNLAIAFGAVIGAYLFKSYHFELFLGVAGVSFISLVITILFISESYIHEKTPSEEEGVKVPTRGPCSRIMLKF